MRTVVIIPARYASARFPGKALTPLRGAAGRVKTLTARVVEAARATPDIAAVVVATDDARIADQARASGVEAVMTAESCRNGTERCAEAVAKLGERPDVVINMQGDAPLTPPDFVTALVAAMRADPTLPTATPGLRTSGAALAHFREDRAAGRVGATTVVARPDGRALYFSKEVVPYTAEAYAPDAPTPVIHHVGLYAYRPEALDAYAATPPSQLEQLEGLEQLRFLEAGVDMKVVDVDAGGRAFWEVNNPVDVPRVEAALAARGIE